MDNLHVGLGADIAGGVVHTALEGPLVEHLPGGVALQVAQGVLGDEDEAEGGDKVVDAVVDLGVDVVGAAADHDDGHTVGPGVGDVFLAGLADVGQVGLIGGVSGLHGRLHFLPGDAELFLHHLYGPLLEVLAPPQAHVGVQEAGLLQHGHIGGQQLGIVGHHGAVVVVVPDALVVVIGHTGIPDGVHTLLHQGLHMAVEELGGVADRVRGDGVLALDVQLAGGLGREDHLEVQLGEEGKPEGEVFVHIQAEGDAHAAPGAVAGTLAVHGPQLIVLVEHQVGVGHLLLAQGAGAAVARDEAAAAVELVDGEGAVVGAQVAGHRTG